tara:strand:- start:309 stop:1031 length:723 start_codon:yes stop_codon:yes gene_type:complete
MAVNVDTVYQRVLSLANKEQRGYITPQEFNLFANQAQFEIFEQYFYDQNTKKKEVIASSDAFYSLIEEKLAIFEDVDGTTKINNATIWATAGATHNKIIPYYVYRVMRVELNNMPCDLLNRNDFNDIRRLGPLIEPSDDHPIANIRKGILRTVGNNSNFVIPTGVFYYRKPGIVNWGYVVLNETALYNANNSIDFEIHTSEETELVYKILKYAGIAIKRDDIMNAGQGLEVAQIQQQEKQ